MTTLADTPAAAALPPPDITIPRVVPWGGVVARLRASELLHRLVPLPVAMPLLDHRHRHRQRHAARRDPARLQAARAAMAAVVGGTAAEADLDELALRHLSSAAQGWELMWRPQLLQHLPVEGLDRLAGIEPGRGVAFSTAHYRPLVGLAALPAAVGTIDAAVGEHLAVSLPPRGYGGYQDEPCRALTIDSDFRPVRATAAARALSRTLTSRGRVVLHFDVPGTHPVQFLGKTVELKNGTARLAGSTGSVIVSVIARPRNSGWYVYVDSPIDPREHDSAQTVLQATADVHSRLVLKAPEHLESPLRAGGWPVATRDGWRYRA